MTRSGPGTPDPRPRYGYKAVVIVDNFERARLYEYAIGAPAWPEAVWNDGAEGAHVRTLR